MPVNPQVTYNVDILHPADSRPGYPLKRNVLLQGGQDIAKGTVMRELIGTQQNDVQTITITGTPTGGTFTVSINGFVTPAIAYNATAATLQAALEALDQVGTGNITVTGGPGPGTAYVLTGSNDFANRPLPVAVVAGSFTGGSSPAIANVHTTTGHPGSGLFVAYSGGTSGAACGVLAQRTITSTGGYLIVSGGSAGVTTQRSATMYNGGDFYTSELPGLDSTTITAMGRIIAGDPSTLTNTNVILRIY